MQQNAVQNQTAVMIEIGTNLLNQTAEQTRKLTDVEAQVSEETENPPLSGRVVAGAESCGVGTRGRRGKGKGGQAWQEKGGLI